MVLNNYLLEIVALSGLIKPREDYRGYVHFEKSNIKYKVLLKNNNEKRCDVKLIIDGKEQGIWRLEPFSEVCIERPSYSDECFTFFRFDSKEGQKVLDYNENLGLIQAIFIPEKKSSITFSAYTSKNIIEEGLISKGLTKCGGTGLTGHSYQKFGIADEIDLDYQNKTTINLRLIYDDEPKKLRDIKYMSNPIPPLVR
jgi:hypothetical protein